MKRGLFVGLTTIDLIYYLKGQLPENFKLKADKQLAFAGGPATNAAITFSALGSKASVVSGLGKNPMSSIAHDDLVKYNVDFIDGLSSKVTPPIISSILIDTLTGNRSVVYSQSIGEKISLEFSTESILTNCQILMLDGHYLDQAINFAISAKKMGIPVVLDGGSWKDGLERALPFVDYAICSANFMTPNCNSVEGVFEFLSKKNIQNIAITRGGKPILTKIENQIVEIPIETVTVIDTLGAGDIFHGAFCHHILDEKFTKSLELAACIASESCKYAGPREWMTL